MSKISVIMSVYKEPIEWMKEAIDSILNQTFQDFEFIIVNDKPDRKENFEVLNQYRQIDSRIKVITNEQNIGLTKSLNKALTIAKGEFIARMDADDVSLPGRFENQILYLMANKKVDVVGGQSYVINKMGTIVSCTKMSINNYIIKLKQKFSLNDMVHSCIFARRKVFDISNGYDDYFKTAQDFELWVRLRHQCVYANLNIPILKYRYNEQSVSRQKANEQHRMGLFAFVKLMNRDNSSSNEQLYKNIKSNIFFKINLLLFDKYLFSKHTMLSKFYFTLQALSFYIFVLYLTIMKK